MTPIVQPATLVAWVALRLLLMRTLGRRVSPVGMDALMVSTLNGIGAMPAKGLCMSCSDNELADAVVYMVDAVQ